MLKKRALRKIFITTLTAFIIISISTIPGLNKEKAIKTNLEIEYITSLGTNSIYLLDKNNYLVKTNILIDTNDKKKQINLIIENLIEKDNTKFPEGLSATIPEDTKLLSVNYDEEYVTLDFNKKFLDVDDKRRERMIESIVYSIMDLGNIKGIIILSDGEKISGYEMVLDKNIGINKEYNIKKRNDISKVVIYYIERINGNNYYVPVTKYLNDSRDKVKIIVDELSSSFIYEPNLMSFLSSNAKLLEYNEQENVMTLNFNNAIFDKNQKIEEEVKYTLAYSVFDNYDVNEVLLEVNGNICDSVSITDLKSKIGIEN